MSKYMSIDKKLEFEGEKLLKIVSSAVKVGTEEGLEILLKYDLYKNTPIDSVRINKEYGTKEELYTNAKFEVHSIEELNGTPIKYEAYLHYGSDPVSKLYAVKQHENRSYIHMRGGFAKFLEDSFKEAIDTEDLFLVKIKQNLDEVL